jgi:hypothetical protein
MLKITIEQQISKWNEFIGNDKFMVTATDTDGDLNYNISQFIGDDIRLDDDGNLNYSTLSERSLSVPKMKVASFLSKMRLYTVTPVRIKWEN